MGSAFSDVLTVTVYPKSIRLIKSHPIPHKAGPGANRISNSRGKVSGIGMVQPIICWFYERMTGSVINGKARSEQIFSALPAKADVRSAR